VSATNLMGNDHPCRTGANHLRFELTHSSPLFVCSGEPLRPMLDRARVVVSSATDELTDRAESTRGISQRDAAALVVGE